MKDVKEIVDQLDKWIDQSEKQVEVFERSHMKTSAISSQAMAQAYWNVKQFIEVNQESELESLNNRIKELGGEG